MELKALLDSLDFGVAVIAPDWRVTVWSAGAARLTGLPSDRVLDQSFWVLFPNARGSYVEEALQDVLHTGATRTYLAPALAPGFSGRMFETTVTPGPKNHVVLVLREVHDELPRESRAAQILSAFESERRLYLQLFHALPSAALVLTEDGQILETNPAGAELLGAPDPRVLPGRRLAEWIPDAQRPTLGGALREALRARQRIHLSITFPGEPAREVDAVIENVVPPEGSPKLLFLALDVSKEVLLQRKLMHTDRMTQLGALVSGVAHEINNPLAAVAAFAELLAVDAPTASVRESAELIQSEAMRAGRVVQTLLDFARQRPRQPQPVDLWDAVDRVLALHTNALKKSRVRAIVEVDERIPPVLADPQELQQVLLNLVVNAEEAIAATGRPGTLRLSAGRSNHHVVILVEDSGPGIPPQLQERAFDPFFTTKGESGAGLGLSICLGLVKANGGRMYLHDVEGGGLRVGVELPAALEVIEPRPAPQVRRADRPLEVLVVDDETGVRRAFEKMAARLGHHVTAAASYGDALERLHDGKSRYDALLIDVHLDAAHSGFDLWDALRMEGRGLERRIVFTTGDSISARTRDALQRSERPVLKKPFNLEELREVLDRVAGE
ncbi:MAG TPA: ATP-binding protein [Gemmatimonadales bacterium]